MVFIIKLILLQKAMNSSLREPNVETVMVQSSHVAADVYNFTSFIVSFDALILNIIFVCSFLKRGDVHVYQKQSGVSSA